MRAAYFVAVILLAWWPWNGWLLLIGAAYCAGLHRRGSDTRRFLSTHLGKSAIDRPKRFHEPLIVRRDP